MNTATDFMAAICANPGDDTVRLAAADWLEENDRPIRAEIFVLQLAGYVLQFPAWCNSNQ